MRLITLASDWVHPASGGYEVAVDGFLRKVAQREERQPFLSTKFHDRRTKRSGNMTVQSALYCPIWIDFGFQISK